MITQEKVRKGFGKRVRILKDLGAFESIPL